MRTDPIAAALLGTPFARTLAERGITLAHAIRNADAVCEESKGFTSGVLAKLRALGGVHALPLNTETPLSDASVAAAYFRPLIGASPVELFAIAILDSHNKPTAPPIIITKGTVNSSLVHPREVFFPAVLARAASIIAAHNHPSGDPTPSEEDKAVTARLFDAGQILGIPLLDHVVIGAVTHASIREVCPEAFSRSK